MNQGGSRTYTPSGSRMAGQDLQDEQFFGQFGADALAMSQAALSKLGQGARRVPWGKVGIVGAAAAPFLGAIGDPNADMGQVALESGGGALGAVAGGALGSMLLPGVGTVLGSTLGGMVGSSAAGGLANMFKGDNGNSSQDFADPRLSDSLRYGRELAKLEFEQASQMAPLIAAQQREQARVQNFLANNAANNEMSMMALNGAINMAMSPSPNMPTILSGMYV